MVRSHIRTLTVLLLAGLSLLFAAAAWGVSYRYDTLNRLTSVSYDNGMAIDYSYDATGNIIRITRTGGNATVPAVTEFTLPDTARTLVVPIGAFKATDDVGVTGYCIAATDSSQGCSWDASAPAGYTFPHGTQNGSHTLYAFAKDAAGNVSASRSTAVNLDLPLVAVNIASVNSGSGSVHSTPAGIACVSGDTKECSATFDADTDVVLIPLGVNSTFQGWSGACTNSSGNCLFTLDVSKSATATFTGDPAKALIEGSTTRYYAIGSALDAVTASGQTVKGRDLVFVENVIATRDFTTRLVGGYTDTALNLRSSASFTTIDGTLKIRRGTLRVDHLKIR